MIAEILYNSSMFLNKIDFRGGIKRGGGAGAAHPLPPLFFSQSLVYFAITLKNYKLRYSKLNWSLIMHF